MKKLITFLLIAAISISVTACSSDTGSSASTSSAPQASSASSADDISSDAAAPSTPESSEAAAPDSGDLGDYSVTIESARLSKDYEDKPVIIVKYKYTNNGDDAESFLTSVSDEAYQGGVQLETAVVGDDKEYNAENSMKNIKTGASLEVEDAYLLTDETSPVEIEVSEFLSLSDDKLTKTFDITKLG